MVWKTERPFVLGETPKPEEMGFGWFLWKFPSKLDKPSKHTSPTRSPKVLSPGPPGENTVWGYQRSHVLSLGGSGASLVKAPRTELTFPKVFPKEALLIFATWLFRLDRKERLCTGCMVPGTVCSLYSGRSIHAPEWQGPDCALIPARWQLPPSHCDRGGLGRQALQGAPIAPSQGWTWGREKPGCLRAPTSALPDTWTLTPWAATPKPGPRLAHHGPSHPLRALPAEGAPATPTGG